MRQLILSAISTLFLAVGASAAGVELRLQAGALSFSGGAGFTNAQLKITGPDDFEAIETASRGLPVFRVRGGRMRDGFYQYTLSAATDEKVEIKRKTNNGRGDAARDFTLKPFHMSGIFQISRGTIVPAAELKAGGDVDATE